MVAAQVHIQVHILDRVLDQDQDHLLAQLTPKVVLVHILDQAHIYLAVPQVHIHIPAIAIQAQVLDLDHLVEQ
jgi:hypothetical protein